MKTIRIGAIATGGRGMLSRCIINPEKGIIMAAGCDIRKEANDNFHEAYPDAKIFTDYRELLKCDDVDAVVIAVPDYLHEEIAIAALKAGKATYLEKPMAITLAGCDRILRTAMETGTKLFVGHNMRHFASVLKMKEVIDSGLIGDVQCGWCRHFIAYGGDAYFRDWHSEQKNSTGLLLQKGAHDIDVMHWLMGTYTKSVVGMGMLSVYNQCERRSPDTPGCAKWSNEQYPPLTQTGFSPIIDVEDHNMIMMQMENGSQACYMQCHYAPDAERNYTFIGTKGRVENIGDAGTCEIHVWTQRTSRQTPDIVYYLKPEVGTHGGADPKILSNFIDFVRNDAKTNTSPVAARNAVAVGCLAHDSMRTDNGRRDIPPLDPELIAYFENGQKKK